MTDAMDWDLIYRHDGGPSWNIGEPQPEMARIIDRDGAVRGEVLDAGCGHAALSLALAARGYAVVGIDLSHSAIAAATAAAGQRGLDNTTFVQADITSLAGYDGRFSTIFDSGLLHALPAERQQDYLHCLHRAAAPGATFYILAFGAGAFPGHTGLPTQFTDEQLRQIVCEHWQVDEIRPARLYARSDQLPGVTATPTARNVESGMAHWPGHLLTAHKER
ncbi:class I SAM-dependent methyltransferase [Mycobacterium sp. 1423905.2]|uniref:class I SAM-dependent methyltransferase n=1 Tax=Mycobacterium sp. 1423905.2 TaxID=1856859 RepID=UPI00080102A7|nr:class I SAM-dependent methyltransferase [Mycobacterium sp. 1423905.2]OBJ52387.1 SAM-dependent methyltransferase [Mycobacterium sp. 1423905.2]